MVGNLGIRIVVLIGLIVVGVAVLVNSWTPRPPDPASLPRLATTILAGPAVPDPVDGEDHEPRALGAACLDPLSRPAGRMDLCWSVTRFMNDGDPVQDYYQLRVRGTAVGDAGTGLRWTAVRARLLGSPSNRVFEGWPDLTFDGACQAVDVALHGPADPAPTEYLCPLTVGSTDPADWSHTVTWSCVGCLLPARDDRGIVLYSFVAVSEGTLPGWEIYGDLGD